MVGKAAPARAPGQAQDRTGQAALCGRVEGADWRRLDEGPSTLHNGRRAAARGRIGRDGKSWTGIWAAREAAGAVIGRPCSGPLRAPANLWAAGRRRALSQPRPVAAGRRASGLEHLTLPLAPNHRPPRPRPGQLMRQLVSGRPAAAAVATQQRGRESARDDRESLSLPLSHCLPGPPQSMPGTAPWWLHCTAPQPHAHYGVQ